LGAKRLGLSRWAQIARWQLIAPAVTMQRWHRQLVVDEIAAGVMG
jgi:hypothetical protein